MLRASAMFGVFTALVLGTTATLAQISGSTGAFGPIDVQSGTETIQLPAGGIIHATTVNVAAGATLKFDSNELNTAVHLLASGDITIAGTINVDGSLGTATGGGAGGPGGFAGGAPGRNGQLPGAGSGPGAGLGGIGSNSTSVVNNRNGLAAYGGNPNRGGATNGSTYGSPLLVPLAGGSGGGGSGPTGTIIGGGGGGGAILLASDTLVEITGAVSATLPFPGHGFLNAGGSGGAVRVVAPVVAGSGTIDVNGQSNNFVSGGHGRIRVDTIDLANVNFTFTPLSAVSLGSFLVGIPPNLPRLDIVEVAGESVPEGTTSSVDLILDFDTPNDQTLTVRATDFGGIVPIRLVITPQNGTPIVTEHDIDMSLGNPQDLTVDLDLPQNVLVNILVFTRDE